MKLKHFSVGVLCLFSSLPVFSQQRSCGAMEHLERMIQENPQAIQRMNDIENFTQAYIRNNQQEKVAVTIPVVVHVVYSTSLQNISDAQIQSQVAVLNNDYRKLNADNSQTPAAFASLAADCQVNFCLASVDPNGNATTGIVRKQTTVSSWTTDDKVKHSSTGGDDAWNATHYLNLWVCNLGGGLLGYAQFPGSGSAATDGVVINYTAFGTTGTAASPYNKGRTATHEIGHWLNLRHIWGDANCGDDLVSDTPKQQTSNYGCPHYPHVTCSNSGDMSMNYMDYTDDACMYMFSNGQKSRMQALFATGGARAGLLASNGCGTATSGGGSTGGGTTASYCTDKGSNVNYEYIKKVQIGTISNTTGANGGYGDFTSLSATLTKGSAYTISLAPGYVSSSYTEYFRVYVDWNNDMDFADAGETVLSAAGTTTSASGSITVPASAVTGNVRMRVVMSDNSSVSYCGSFTYGEVEDYTLHLIASSGGTGGGTTTCTDTYESNNTLATAKSITNNGTISALISTTSDVDYFKFTTTSSAPKVRIQLTGLPADYDIKLYKASGAQLGSSANGGTTSETIKYNSSSAAATYYVRVFGYSGAHSATSCYSLTINTSSSNFKDDGSEEITVEKPQENAMIVAPNPTVTGNVNIELTSVVSGSYSLMIIDAAGRIVFTTDGTKEEGEPLLVPASLEQYSNGLYTIRLSNEGSVQTERLILNK